MICTDSIGSKAQNRAEERPCSTVPFNALTTFAACGIERRREKIRRSGAVLSPSAYLYGMPIPCQVFRQWFLPPSSAGSVATAIMGQTGKRGSPGTPKTAKYGRSAGLFQSGRRGSFFAFLVQKRLYGPASRLTGCTTQWGRENDATNSRFTVFGPLAGICKGVTLETPMVRMGTLAKYYPPN